jgi:hypothetical protein
MLFGKRDKKTPNERVVDLKARVDALRQADQTRQGLKSLDQFLEGDDVLTGREVEDHYRPAGLPSGTSSGTPASDYEAALAAELQKYLQREEARALHKEVAAEPPAPVPPLPAEPGSLLLDGTWSRDADRRTDLTDADRAWGLPEPSADLSEKPPESRPDEREAI